MYKIVETCFKTAYNNKITIIKYEYVHKIYNTYAPLIELLLEPVNAIKLTLQRDKVWRWCQIVRIP